MKCGALVINSTCLSVLSSVIHSQDQVLAVRILGDITREKVRILQDADDIYIENMHEYTMPDGFFSV
jgi:phage host-nuclease inhibitor protein Gam